MSDLFAIMRVGALTGLAIAIPVGAVGTLLVLHACQAGIRRGSFAALGVASADGGYALLAALGGVALKEHLGGLMPTLQVVSTVTLLSIGVLLSTRAFRSTGAGLAEASPPSASGSYWSFLGLTAVNPLTLVYFCSVAVGTDDVTLHAGIATVFAASALAASAAWQLCLVAAAIPLRGFVTRPGGRTVTHLFAAALVLAMAVRGIVS